VCHDEFGDSPLRRCVGDDVTSDQAKDDISSRRNGCSVLGVSTLPRGELSRNNSLLLMRNEESVCNLTFQVAVSSDGIKRLCRV